MPEAILHAEIGTAPARKERALLRHIVQQVRRQQKVGFNLINTALNALPLGSEAEELHILGFSRATLQRTRKSRAAIDPVAADRVARALRLKAEATEVFASRGDADIWMKTPNPGLDGKRPIDLAGDDAGTKEVEMALWRVREGIPA